jgi:hypothetical protein
MKYQSKWGFYAVNCTIIRKLFLLFAAFFAFKGNAQQVARATNVQMVTEPGTKVVLQGGISFIGTSTWLNNGETHLYKTTAPSPEGWLDSTASGVLINASTGHVFFRGTNRQSFYGKTRFYDLTVRNTAGDTLLSSCEVRNNLHLDTGFVFTRSGYGLDSLLVSNPSVNAISSTSNYSKSWVNGRLSRTGSIIGTPSSNFYLFPVGKTDMLYAPVKLSKVNATAATWTAEYWFAPPYDRLNIQNPPIDHISYVEYWEITSNDQFSTNDDARVSLSWRGQSQVSNNAATRDGLLVAQYINNTGFIWDVPGFWATGNTSGADSLFGYVNSNSPSSNYTFDERRFTLGTIYLQNPLPIKLIYFTAIADGNKVRLNWEAANEQETRRYEIEKSLNATSFSFLGTVNSRQMQQSAYVDFDNNPATGWNYYRLKIIEKTGNYSYSPVRPVMFSKGREEVQIFPNPVTDILNVQLPGSYLNKAIMQLLSFEGKIVSSFKPTVNNIKMNVKLLTGGAYVIRIIKENGETETHRFIKQ